MENKQKVADVNPSLSVTALNVNGLNTSIKTYRLAEWIFFKTMVLLYSVSKSSNLDPKTQMGWKGKNENRDFI